MTELARIAPQVWGAETRISLGAGAALPLRMTVLRDARGLTLISPIELTDALRTELQALGPVHTILGPNLLHYRWLTHAKEHYPDALLLGPPGLTRKRPELTLDAELAPGSVGTDVTAFLVEGAPKLSEFVFFHTPSKTLIVTDLVFNVRRATGMTWLILKTLSRTLGLVEQSRLLRMFTADRQATARSIQKLLALPFERVIPAHGEVVEANANALLTSGTWWMRGERRRPTVHA